MKIALIFSVLMALAIINVAARDTWHKVTQTQRVPRLTDNRIVGGVEVDIARAPYQVSLRYKILFDPSYSYSHFCGGSIYSDTVVITAAHCIIGTVPSQFQIAAGTSNCCGGDGIIVPVKDIIMHQDYDPSTAKNDIAIMILAAPLPLNNFTIQAIALTESEVPEGATSIITGWGDTTPSGTPADKLQEVRVPIVSNAACNEDYKNIEVDDSMLCAGLRGVGGKDACQGDSGGPLVVNGKLAGVTSWGYGCALPQYPGVYAKVSHLRPWLLEKLEEYKINLN